MSIGIPSAMATTVGVGDARGRSRSPVPGPAAPTAFLPQGFGIGQTMPQSASATAFPGLGATDPMQTLAGSAPGTSAFLFQMPPMQNTGMQGSLPSGFQFQFSLLPSTTPAAVVPAAPEIATGVVPAMTAGVVPGAIPGLATGGSLSTALAVPTLSSPMQISVPNISVGASSLEDLMRQKQAYEQLMQEQLQQLQLKHQQEQLQLAAYHQQLALQRIALQSAGTALPTASGIGGVMQGAAAGAIGTSIMSPGTLLENADIPGVTDVRFEGKVLMINKEKSFGFIANPPELAAKFTKKDVFIHRSDAPIYGIGDVVSFGIRLHKDGRPQARDMELVTAAGDLINKNPILSLDPEPEEPKPMYPPGTLGGPPLLKPAPGTLGGPPLLKAAPGTLGGLPLLSRLPGLILGGPLVMKAAPAIGPATGPSVVKIED